MRKQFSMFLIAFYALAFIGCKRESLIINQENEKISDSRVWFENFLATNKVNEMFKDIKYHWNKAKIFEYKNGYKVITVPLLETNQNKKYNGRRILYLYPWKNGKGYYSTIFELLPDINHSKINKGNIDLKTFSGYINTWDLKKGFSRGAKYVNGQPIENISLELKKDINSNKIETTSIKPSALAMRVTDVVPAPMAGWGFYWITLLNSLGYSTSFLWDGGNYENPCEYSGCTFSENPEDYFDKDMINTITQELYDLQWIAESVTDSTNKPCVTDALNTLTSITTKLPKLIRNFFGNNASFNMKLTYENLGSSKGGETVTNVTTENMQVKINSYFDKATDLALASTIIHEAFHCQMMSWFRIAYTQNDTVMRNTIAQEFGFIFSTEIKNMDSSLAYIVNGGNATQHQAIATRYIDMIADALYEFAQKKSITNITLAYCKDLAWSGLVTSNAFNNLSYNNRARIIDHVNAEKDPDSSKGININNISPKGNICP